MIDNFGDRLSFQFKHVSIGSQYLDLSKYCSCAWSSEFSIIDKIFQLFYYRSFIPAEASSLQNILPITVWVCFEILVSEVWIMTDGARKQFEWVVEMALNITYVGVNQVLLTGCPWNVDNVLVWGTCMCVSSFKSLRMKVVE